MKKGFFHKLKTILLEYDTALSMIKKERGIKHAFFYLLLFLLFTQLFMVLYYSKVSLPRLGLSVELDLSFFILVYGVTSLLLIGFSFLRPWLTNLFVRLFQKKARFEDTYKAMVYGASPGYVVTPFFVGFMLGMAFLPKAGIWLFFLSALGLISLAGLIYEWILRVRGMSSLHKISIWKAILCLYVFPLLLLILVEVVLITISVFLFFAFR